MSFTNTWFLHFYDFSSQISKDHCTIWSCQDSANQCKDKQLLWGEKYDILENHLQNNQRFTHIKNSRMESECKRGIVQLSGPVVLSQPCDWTIFILHLRTEAATKLQPNKQDTKSYIFSMFVKHFQKICFLNIFHKTTHSSLSTQLQHFCFKIYFTVSAPEN